MRASALVIAAALCGCVAPIDTPSGRPELRVSLKPPEVKTRIVKRLSGSSAILERSDDMGLAYSAGLSPFEEALVGQGQKRTRFNFIAIDEGTHITATCELQHAGSRTDTTTGKAGVQIQELLENEFAREKLPWPGK